MKPWIRNLGLIASICLIGLATWRGRTVPFHLQWPLYEALRSTAAIIFAVIGAWLAIAYPERLRLSLGRKTEDASSEPSDETSGVVTLLAPIVHSTAILAAVLTVGILAPLAREAALVKANIECFRGISYGFVTTLTLWQLWTVVLTLIPASEVRTEMIRERSLQNTTRALFSRARKKTDKA